MQGTMSARARDDAALGARGDVPKRRRREPQNPGYQSGSCAIRTPHLFNAYELDKYYARLVQGASGSTNFNFVWVSDQDHSQLDAQEFKGAIWGLVSNAMNRVKQLRVEEFKSRDPNVAGARREGAMDVEKDNVLEWRVIADVMAFKKAIENVWEDRAKFRISNQVHIIEYDILKRLHRDGAFPVLGSTGIPGSIDQLRVCFVMRRCPQLRYQFATAVGKRLLSETIVLTQRAQLVEHHRTARWAEGEYSALYRLMTQGGGIAAFNRATGFIRLAKTATLDEMDAVLQGNELTRDYVRMHPDHRPMTEDGEDDGEGDFGALVDQAIAENT